MPAKGSSKNPRYLGLDERGYPTWQGACGHPVYGRKTKWCQSCYGMQKRTTPNNAGKLNGRSVYTAGCGHLVANWTSKQCAACRHAGRSKKYDGGWYKTVREPGSNGSRGKKNTQHRIIAEQALGRKLKPGEVVHHVNMDKTDNRRCNLLICTREYHRFLHVQMERATAARIRAWQDAQGV